MCFRRLARKLPLPVENKETRPRIDLIVFIVNLLSERRYTDLSLISLTVSGQTLISLSLSLSVCSQWKALSLICTQTASWGKCVSWSLMVSESLIQQL